MVPVRASSLAALLIISAGAASAGVTVEAGPDGHPRARFTLAAKGAHSVNVAGSFNAWSATDQAWALSDPDGDGTFEGTFTLPDGKQSYKFVVDGSRWQPDPDNTSTEPDGHGGENSLLEPARPAEPGDRTPTGGAAASPFGSTQERPRTFVGTIYYLEPNTQRLPDLDHMEPHGKIFAETLDVGARKFSDGFPGLTDRFEWFAIRYAGTYEAPREGVYRFRLIADDGAKVSIDGHLALDDDGLHSPREVVQLVRLSKGPHPIVVDYMQGPALEVALRLLVIEADRTEEVPVRVSPPRAAPSSDRRR
jgi:hypothetical protein